MKHHSKMRVWFSAVLAILLVVAMVLPLVYEVFAAPTDAETNRLNSINAQQAELREAIRAAEAERDDKVAKKQAYDKVLYMLSDQIAGVEGEISALDTEISDLEQGIEEQNEELDERTRLFRNRAAALYEQGGTSYLDILLNADSFSNFLQRLEISRNMFEYDKKRIAGIKQVRAQLEADRNRVVTAREEQAARREELSAKRKTQNEQISALNTVLAELNRDIKTLEAMENQLASEQRKIQEQIRAREQQQKSDGTLGSYSGGAMVWPTPSTRYITSEYGTRIHPILKTQRFHSGVDIGAWQGADILSANSGTVIFSGVNGGYGNCLIIDHGGGIKTLYGHCSQLLVANGEKVSAGQKIAYVGSTGLSSGPHLHFEIYVNGSTVNPMSYY